MSKKTNVSKLEQLKAHALAVSVIVGIALLVVFELSPFGGNVRFYAKWIECGQKPLAGGGELVLGTKLHSYREPSAFQPIRALQPQYFCTPLEAELAGYSANPNTYEFPHINSQK